eukprot:257773_1
MLSLWLLLVWIKEAQSLTLQDINDLLITSGNIGWLKVTQCTSSKWIYEPPFTDVNSVVDLLPHAISFKLVPVDNAEIQVSDFELEAVICSNPIWNLNHAKELSFTTDMNTGLVIGYEDYDNWIGTQTAKGRLDNPQFDSHLGTCPVIGDAPRDFLLHVYDCCGCDQGLYIDFSLLKSPSCKWLFEANPVFYPAMVMWLGFDVDLRKFCQEDGNGNYVLTTATTLPPSTNPSNTPSTNPSKTPSTNPTQTPSVNPSQTPSGTPSSNPTDYPTELPSDNPTLPPFTDNPSTAPTKQHTNNKEERVQESTNVKETHATISDAVSPDNTSTRWIVLAVVVLVAVLIVIVCLYVFCVFCAKR